MASKGKSLNLRKLKVANVSGGETPTKGNKNTRTKQLSISRFFTEHNAISKPNTDSANVSPGQPKIKPSTVVAKPTKSKRKGSPISPDENVLIKRTKTDLSSSREVTKEAIYQDQSPIQLADSTVVALRKFSVNTSSSGAFGSSTTSGSPSIENEDGSFESPSASQSQRSDVSEASSSISTSSSPLNAFRYKLSTWSTKSPSVKSQEPISGIKKTTYTPLEKQFMAIKEEYPNAVLFVECGYRYRFFGEDAIIASKELNIFAHLDHNFMSASIPIHRLFVHTRRLVAKGYKVGVVKQMETAALKAVGDNKNAPFERKLTALYTKSTLIGEDLISSFDGSDSEGADLPSDSTPNNFLLCLKEFQKPGTKSAQEENIQFGLVAVQPSTGEMIYDCFYDNRSLQALDTRIHHIQPVELLLPNNLSERTEKFLKDVVCSSVNENDRIRIERLSVDSFDQTQAFQEITKFFTEENNDDQKNGAKLQEVISLPPPVVCCMAAVLKYLKEFQLDRVLKLTSNFKSFSSTKKYMKLDACALRNLEIFENQVDRGSKGSLFWVLNHTQTKFGCRQLREWLSKPLMDKREIESRQVAVEEIIQSSCPAITKLTEFLFKVPDLEKGLCNIYHKKCSPAEFYSTVKKLHQVLTLCTDLLEVAEKQLKSSLLLSICKEVPQCLKDVTDYMNTLNEKAAKEGDKTKLFADPSQFASVHTCSQQIASIEASMLEHRREIRLHLKVPALDFVTVSGNEYLVEIKNSQLKLIPNNWVKISATKQVSRFRPPKLEESYKELCQVREQLNSACQDAWLQFLESFGEKYFCYRQAVGHLATFDCLYAMAEVAKQNEYVRPTIKDGPACIHIKNGKHPVISSLLGEREQFVPNSTHIEAERERCIIITGPNMGGKSSYIKQVALIAILAQIGSFVPAEEAEFTVLDAIYTRMGSSDNIYKNQSTFMVELQEAAVILKEATSKSLVILDELGRGTSTHDGVAIAHATANYLIEEVKCLTLFVTHYPPLADLEKSWPGNVGNYHMSFIINDTQEQKENLSKVEVLTFLYQLVRGVASRSYGLNVARLADIPEGILEVATRKSRELEEKVVKSRKKRDNFRKLWDAPNKEEILKLRL